MKSFPILGEIADRLGRILLSVALFHLCQNILGTCYYASWHPCHLGNVNTKAVIAPSWHKFAQENDVLPHLLDRYIEITNPAERLFHFVQFVVMGCEQSLCLHPWMLMDVFHDRPGDGDTVVSTRTAAQFVEKDQAPVGEVVQDACCFRHLHHKGRFPGGDIVGSPYPGEYLVDVTNAGSLCRHIRANLGQQDDQCSLAEQCRLTCHIWPCNHDDLLFRIIQGQVVGDVLLPHRQLLFNNRMPSSLDLQQVAVVHIRTDIFILNRDSCKGAQAIDLGRQVGIQLDGLVIFTQ